jgi:type VI protein secretion system component Hcp
MLTFRRQFKRKEETMRQRIFLASFAAALLVAMGWSVSADAKDKAKISEMPVVKTMDKSSPKLMDKATAPRDAATGQATGKRR